MSLDAESTLAYWEAITPIEAQEALIGLTVSAYPHMSKEGQRKVHRDLHSKAYTEKKSITPQQLGVMIKSGAFK